MVSLPNLKDLAALRSWRTDASQWLPVVHEIASHHGLAAVAPRMFATGTNLVLALDDRLILKIFPPFHRDKFVSERGALSRLSGRLSIAIPEIVCMGERDQWPYLVITRVPGLPGEEVWPALAEDQKERVLAELGATIAEVQRVSPSELTEIGPDWAAFLHGQIEGCRARHERLGLPRKFLDGLDDLLRDAAVLIPLDRPPVILTGEYIPENFLLSNERGEWHLAGLIDFGDLLMGWGEYDLLGPSAFMAAGRPRRVRNLFEGFGYTRADIDFALKRRLMALMLLHRASDPNRHICIEGWQDKAADLYELQELVWPD